MPKKPKKKLVADSDGYLDTGIYRRYVGPPKNLVPCTPELLEEAFSSTTTVPHASTFIANAIAWAADILRPMIHGIYQPIPSDEFRPEGHIVNIGDGWKMYQPKPNLSDMDREIFLDCSEFMSACHFAEKHINDPELLPYDFYQIGKIEERIRIRPYEPFVPDGVDVSNRRSAGGHNRGPLSKAEWQLVVAERDLRAEKSKHVSITNASAQLSAELLAGKFPGIDRSVELSPETIRKKKEQVIA